MLWWFYHPHPRNTRFGTFPDVCGLVLAISQCISSAVQYVYLHRHAENPIKLSVLPVMFIICLAVSTCTNTGDETLEHTS